METRPLSVDEVCQKTGVRPYVLRFWESEFPELASSHNEQGHRIYGEREVETIFFIKKLLFEEKLSIEKARLKMLEQKRAQDFLGEAAPGITKGLHGQRTESFDRRNNFAAEAGRVRSLLEDILNSVQRAEKLLH